MKPGTLLLVLLVFAGCRTRGAGTPPLDEVSPPGLAPAFSDTGEAPLAARWWTAFGDPVLDDLVDTALGDNPGLAALRERMVRAAALARRAASPLRPTLDATAGAGVVASGRDFEGDSGTDVDEVLSLGAAAAYEVDLWGRLRAIRDAAVWEARATEGDLQAARISLAATVADTWYRLVAEARTGALLEEQKATNEKLLVLIEERFKQGKIGAADVLRQQQLVESTHGDRVQSASREAVLRHALATLLGRAATDPLPGAPAELVAPPPLPRTGVPGEVLRRRPDVAAAWHRVRSADRELAVALADRYPRLRLSAEALLGGAGLSLLFRDWLARLAADLTAPLFDGGERRAQIEADCALRRERLYRYGETLLVAVQEVEDALVQERQAAEYLASLRRQLELARRVIQTLLSRYGQGAAAYLDVLAALTAEQALARSVVGAQREILEHRISLCRALAGEWPAAE